MIRTTALLISAIATLCGCTRSNDVTPAPVGLLVQFDTQALHSDDTTLPSGDAHEFGSRCTFVWPDDADQGFTVLTEASHVGGVFSNISITTVESDCSLDAVVESPVRFYELDGLRDTRSELRLNYVCPSGQGSASLSVSFGSILMGGSTATCIPID